MPVILNRCLLLLLLLAIDWYAETNPQDGPMRSTAALCRSSASRTLVCKIPATIDRAEIGCLEQNLNLQSALLYALRNESEDFRIRSSHLASGSLPMQC